MAKGITLTLGNSQEDQRLLRVLAFLGLAQRLQVQRAAATALGELTHPNTILRHICQQIAPELTGSDALQTVFISQWADLASLIVQRDDRFFLEKAAKIDEHLQRHSFLAANKFSFADAYIVEVIATQLETNPQLAAALQPLTNLKRWLEFVQPIAYGNAQGSGVPVPKQVYLPVEHAPLVVPKLSFGGKSRGATEQKESEAKPAKQGKKQKHQQQQRQQQQEEGAAAAAPADGEKKKKAKQQQEAAPAAEGEQQQQQQGKKKEKKEKKPKAEAKADEAETKGAEGDDADVSKLDIRVGHIRRVWEHEDSEKLFCEEIDIGEEAPRSIASGLRPFYKLADLQDRKVLVVANLKPRNMGGFSSQGMVMCASNDDHSVVKFIEVPASAKPGDRVTFDAFPGEPASAAQVQKKKVLEKVLPELVTDSNGVPTYKGCPFKVNGEVCTSELSNAHVG